MKSYIVIHNKRKTTRTTRTNQGGEVNFLKCLGSLSQIWCPLKRPTKNHLEQQERVLKQRVETNFFWKGYDILSHIPTGRTHYGSCWDLLLALKYF